MCALVRACARVCAGAESWKDEDKRWLTSKTFTVSLFSFFLCFFLSFSFLFRPRAQNDHQNLP